MTEQSPSDRLFARTITVSGVGEASRMPDIAVLQVGVVVLDNDPAPARRETAKRVSAILDAIAALGIAKTDLATASISVTTDRDWNGKRKGANRVRGYTVSTTIAVTVRNLDLLGAIFDAAVAAGANQVNGPSWQLEQPEAVQDEALVAAFADARRKALLLVAAAGAKLGPVRTISDGSEPRSYGRPMYSRMAVRLEEAEPEMRFEAEEQTESASVTVVWDILAPADPD